MIDEELFQSVVKIRRDLHQNPEIGFDVERTAGIAAEKMRKLGTQVKTKVGKTGVVADLNISGAKERVAFRADMDALPMQEEGNLPYKSTAPGKAHMCGHDSHTAMLIGAATALCQSKGDLKKNIRFIFQPSEEQRPGGALGMIQDGCLEGVTTIYGLHVWPWLDTGTVGICPGPMLAQSDCFDIEIRGKGGHAAAPHQTVDPILVGSHLVTMMQSLTSRRTDPLHSAVVSVTRFDAGSAYNVIAETATLSGTVRTYSKKALEIIKSEMQQMLEKGAESFGAVARLNYQDGYPPLINKEVDCAFVKDTAKSFLKENQIIYPAAPAMFGEDFAYYLEKIPGCFIQLGCRNAIKECVFPLHHPRFNLDEECMKVGIRLIVELATSRIRTD